MRVMLAAFLAVVCFTSAYPALAAGDATTGLPPGIARADSIARALCGTWISDADPKGVIQITHAGLTTLQVWGGGRFAATGFIDGDAFFGIARLPGLRMEPTGASSPEVLTFRILPSRVIAAEFADDLQHHGARVEKWTPVPPDWRPPDSKALPASADSLPVYGQFVYVEELPQLISQVPPEYPTWAREHGVSGTVQIQALVGRDGTVKDTRITHSIPELDDYAVGAVKQWRFKPALTKGKPVAVWVAIPVKFTLH